MPDKDRFMGILGLRIERRIDIASIAALFLSLIAVGWDVLTHFRGPQVEVIPSESITVFANYCESSNQFLELIMSTAYVNTARFGHNDVILDEKIHLKFPPRWNIDPVQLHAGEVVKETDNEFKPSLTFCAERNRHNYYPGVTIENGQGQIVAPINGGSAIARTIHFFVDSKICGKDWRQCKVQSEGVEVRKFLTKVRVGDELEIEFHAKLLVNGNRVRRCVVEFSKEMMEHFRSNYNLPTDCNVVN